MSQIVGSNSNGDDPIESLDLGPDVSKMRIRSSLILNIVALILILSGTIMTVMMVGASKVGREVSVSYLHEVGDRVTEQLNGFFSPIEKVVLISRQWARNGTVSPVAIAATNQVYIPLLASSPQITSIATGATDGYSYRLGSEGKNFLTRITYGGDGRDAEFAKWSELGDQLKTWTEESTYDARTRPWFDGALEVAARGRSAREENDIYWTDPFILHTSKAPGISASTVFTDQDDSTYVMTFNVMLSKVSEFTTSRQPSANGRVFVLSDDGRVIGFPGDVRYRTAEARAKAIRANEGELPYLSQLGIPALTTAAETWEDTRIEEAFRYKIDGKAWWASFRPYRLGAERVIWVGIALPEDDFLGAVKRLQRIIFFVALAALGLAILMALTMAKIYGRPLRRLVAQSERITTLDLLPHQPIHTHVLEAHQLAVAQERMRAALDSFARYIPTEVVRELLRRGEAAQIGGTTEELTIMFSDIRGFTTIAESMTPEDLTTHLATYFEALLRIITEENGTVDKLIGDAIMAVWGAPMTDEEHARNAVNACLRCRDFLVDFNAECDRQGLPKLLTGFGLATGDVVVGNVGSPTRLNYTAIGDSVNLSARLEGATKLYGADILVSEGTRAKTGDAFVWQALDVISVKGKTEPVKVYEVLGRTGEVASDVLERASQYEKALDAYLASRFEEAKQHLEVFSSKLGDDKAVLRLRAAAEAFIENPPPADWDGSSHLTSK